MPLNKKQKAIKNALGGNLFPQTGIDDRLSDVDRKAVKKRGRQAKRAIKADGRLSDVDRKTMLKAARRTFRLK